MAYIPIANQGTGNGGSSPWAVSGSVTVTNALSVSIPNPLGVSGTITALQGTSPFITSGGVTVSNFPASQSVLQGTTPWITSGGVSLGSPIPPGTSIIGKVSQDTSPWIVSGGVSIGSPIPPGSNIIGKVSQDTSPWIVSGGLTVSNFPATQSVTQSTTPWIVSGGVSLGSPIPPGSNIIGKVSQDTSPWVVSGGVTVSQLPAPSGLIDGTANPTTILIGDLPHVWSGTAWNRCLDITAANGLSFLGAGLPAVGLTVFDTVNAQYRRINSAASAIAGGLDGTRIMAVGNLVFGSSNYWPQKGFTDGTAVVSGGMTLGAPIPSGTNTIGKVSQDTSPWVISGGVAIGSPIGQQPTSGSISVTLPSDQAVFGSRVQTSDGNYYALVYDPKVRRELSEISLLLRELIDVIKQGHS